MKECAQLLGLHSRGSGDPKVRLAWHPARSQKTGWAGRRPWCCWCCPFALCTTAAASAYIDLSCCFALFNMWAFQPDCLQHLGAGSRAAMRDASALHGARTNTACGHKTLTSRHFLLHATVSALMQEMVAEALAAVVQCKMPAQE